MKKVIFVLLVAFMIVGCGGGGDSKESASNVDSGKDTQDNLAKAITTKQEAQNVSAYMNTAALYVYAGLLKDTSIIGRSLKKKQEMLPRYYELKECVKGGNFTFNGEKNGNGTLTFNRCMGENIEVNGKAKIANLEMGSFDKAKSGVFTYENFYTKTSSYETRMKHLEIRLQRFLIRNRTYLYNGDTSILHDGKVYSFDYSHYQLSISSDELKADGNVKMGICNNTQSYSVQTLEPLEFSYDKTSISGGKLKINSAIFTYHLGGRVTVALEDQQSFEFNAKDIKLSCK